MLFYYNHIYVITDSVNKEHESHVGIYRDSDSRVVFLRTLTSVPNRTAEYCFETDVQLSVLVRVPTPQCLRLPEHRVVKSRGNR
jgi:hypothetical protein